MFSDNVERELKELRQVPFSSQYFSAPRLLKNSNSIAKAAIGAEAYDSISERQLSEPAPKGLNVFTQLSLENLILTKSDKVMDEAKMLLNQWIANDEHSSCASFRPRFEDEYNLVQGWIKASNNSSNNPKSTLHKDQYKKSSSDLVDVRKMIYDSIPADCKNNNPGTKNNVKKASLNLGLAMEARQQMVRERKRILDKERALHKLEAVASIVRPAPKMLAAGRLESRARKFAELQVAQKIAHQEMDAIKQRQSAAAAEAAAETLRLHKQGNLSRLKEEEQEHAVKGREQELQLAMEKAYTKAEAMKSGHDEKLQRRFFSEWWAVVQEFKQAQSIYTIKKNWRTTTKSWYMWKKKSIKAQQARELRETALGLKLETFKMAKALTHFRARLLSSALLRWKEYVCTSKQEKAIRLAHAKRAKKMNEFLILLEQRQQEKIKEIVGDLGSKQEEIAAELPSKGNGNTNANTKTKSCKRNSVDNASFIQQNGHGATSKDCVPRDNPAIPKEKPRPKAKPFTPSKNDQLLVQAMREREETRRIRKQQIETQKQDKKLHLEMIELEAKLEKERAEKMEQEMIRQERMRLVEISRQVLAQQRQERQANKAKMETAISFYENGIQRRLILRPLAAFVQRVKLDHGNANLINQMQCQRIVFLEMKSRVFEKRDRNERRAVEFDKNAISTLGFLKWGKMFEKKKEKYIVGEYISRNKVFCATFQRWKREMNEKLEAKAIIQRKKDLLADEMAKRLVPKRYLKYWKDFVIDKKEEKWREYKRNQLRETAKEILSTRICGLDNYFKDVC